MILYTSIYSPLARLYAKVGYPIFCNLSELLKFFNSDIKAIAFLCTDLMSSTSFKNIRIPNCHCIVKMASIQAFIQTNKHFDIQISVRSSNNPNNHICCVYFLIIICVCLKVNNESTVTPISLMSCTCRIC